MSWTDTVGNFAKKLQGNGFANDIGLPTLMFDLASVSSNDKNWVGDAFNLAGDTFRSSVLAASFPVRKAAGFTIQKGDIVFDKEFDSFDYIWVVTTDFLANGGDKMSFFQQATARIETNVLLRDVLMDAVRAQQEIGKENYTARINW